MAYAEARGVPAQEVAALEQVPGGGLRGAVAGHTCLAGNARLMEDGGVDVAAVREQAQCLADEGKTVLYFALDGEMRTSLPLMKTPYERPKMPRYWW